MKEKLIFGWRGGVVNGIPDSVLPFLGKYNYDYFRFIRPPIKAEVFESLKKVAVGSVDFNPKPSLSSHFAGAFVRIDGPLKTLFDTRNRVVRAGCFKEVIHSSLCCWPDRDWSRFYEFLANPDLFYESLNRLVEAGHIDPNMVAKSGFIRILFYTTKWGYKKYFISNRENNQTVVEGLEYSQILGPDGRPINLPQGGLLERFSLAKKKSLQDFTDEGRLQDDQQYINVVGMDIPFNILDKERFILEQCYDHSNWMNKPEIVLINKFSTYMLNNVLKVEAFSSRLDFSSSALINGSEVGTVIESVSVPI